MRKPRSDSITAAVRSFQAGTFAVPDYVTLRECDLPFWRAAIACRNDWKQAELFMVAVLARALADCERLHREIADEGNMVDGRINPKHALLETLVRRTVTLTRHLQIHARATRGEARQVARLAVVPTGDDNPLIPRLPRQ